MAGGLMKRKAFTLIELLVVIAIIAILIGAIGSAVARARARAKIARAETEVNEMTNAIRAYENYVDTGLQEMSDEEATESKMSFILGGGKDRNGKEVPVLYNAHITGTKILDPWGKAYRVRIRELPEGGQQDAVASALNSGVYIPNRYRRNRKDK